MMFDYDRGKEVAKRAYDHILEREDVSLWYEDPYYSIGECWARAAGEYVQTSDMSDEDVTGLMAWALVEDDAFMAFSDGFTYIVGSALQSEYEMGGWSE